MKCKPCEGTGKVQCGECRGEGYRFANVACRSCSGGGLTDCGTCKSTGKIGFFQWLRSG